MTLHVLSLSAFATPSENPVSMESAVAVALPQAPERQTSKRLLVAGVTTFAVAYTPTLLFAAGITAQRGPETFHAELGFVPLAGPFLWQVAETADGNHTSGAGLIVVGDGVAQVAGAGLIVAGILTRHPLPLTPSVRVGDGLELGVSGRF